MSQELEHSSGAIFRNDYKQNENQPDWIGKLEITNDLIDNLKKLVGNNLMADVQIALWNRTSKSGKEYKYARLSIPKEKQENSGSDSEKFDDGDMPF